MIDKDLCPYCGNGEATEDHHLIKRSERIDLVNDKENKLKICNDCHSKDENDQSFHKKLQRIFLSKEYLKKVNYHI